MPTVFPGTPAISTPLFGPAPLPSTVTGPRASFGPSRPYSALLFHEASPGPPQASCGPQLEQEGGLRTPRWEPQAGAAERFTLPAGRALAPTPTPNTILKAHTHKHRHTYPIHTCTQNRFSRALLPVHTGFEDTYTPTVTPCTCSTHPITLSEQACARTCHTPRTHTQLYTPVHIHTHSPNPPLHMHTYCVGMCGECGV